MLFKRTETPELKKSIAVYISNTYNQIIICPRYQNKAGINYEQDTCSLLKLSVDPSVFGDEVLRNLHLFSSKDKNLKDQKKTDWPAFKFSKLKSVKSFEDSYFLINISGNNESNLILIIEAPFVGHQGMFITTKISSSPANKRMIGECIIQLYETALNQASVKQ